MASFMKVFRGSADSSAALRAELKSATDSGIIDIPKEIVSAIVEKSQHEDDRKVIMMHLRECLAEQQGKRWRRVHAGLVLVDRLVQDGSTELILEAAEGRHFDVVQRVSLLEKFEYSTDVRAQKMIRSKASALRTLLVSRMQNAETIEPAKTDALNDSRSTCSPGGMSTASESTACTDFDLDNKTQISNETVHAVLDSIVKPTGMMVLNGIVAVGHSDDTTSGSSDEDTRKKTTHANEQRKVVRKTRRERSHCTNYSSDSDDAAKNPLSYLSHDTPPSVGAASQSVDLLGF